VGKGSPAFYLAPHDIAGLPPASISVDVKPSAAKFVT